MSRSHRLAALTAVLAITATAVWFTRDRHGTATARRAPAASGPRSIPLHRGLAGAAADGLAPDAAPGPLRLPPDQRVEAFLAVHPPSAELTATMTELAAAARALNAPIVTGGDDDESAIAAEAARVERRERHQAFRGQLRAALAAMTPDERAAMRAAHLNVLVIAHRVATANANG